MQLAAYCQTADEIGASQLLLSCQLPANEYASYDMQRGTAAVHRDTAADMLAVHWLRLLIVQSSFTDCRAN